MGVLVRKRGGAWWVFVNHKGKRRAKKVGSRAAANELKAKIEARVSAGDLGILEKPGITFAVAAERWLEGYVRPHLKPRSYDLYALLTRCYLLPVFGDTPLRALTRGQIREAMVGLYGKCLSPKYVHTITATLSGILKQAIEDEHLDHNPAVGLGRYTARQAWAPEAQERVKFWTGEQVARILARTRKESPEWYDLFATMAWAGLRVGEALGLQWADVEDEERVLVVRRSVDRRNGEFREGTPKSNRARRVQMAEPLVWLLADRRSRVAAEAVAAGQAPCEWVFPARDGQPVRYVKALQILAAVLDQEKIPRYDRVMTHAFRHSWATWVLQNAPTPGAILYVSRQLGHASVKITLDVYGHLIPEENRHLSDLMAEATRASIATPAQLATVAAMQPLEIPNQDALGK